MIITKFIGLSAFLAGSKKTKIALLGIEMAILAYALIAQKKEKKKRKSMNIKKL